eukprot:1874883-Rhodomonas_salina.1
MIEGGAYYSDVVEESNEIISAHFDSLASEMGQFVSSFTETPTKGQAICIQPFLSSALVGCFAVQGAVVHINSVANMNATNLTTFRE